MADETVPEMLQEPTPDVPAPEPETPSDTPPTSAATGWRKVQFLAPNDIDLPVEYAGRWWHANSEHVLPAECAAPLLAFPGFSDMGDAPKPVNAQPCTGCGATPAP